MRNEKIFRRTLWLLVFVQAVLTVAYAVVKKDCVADESVHIQDVLRYYFVGINVETIRAHINPAAPGPYIWSALGAKVFGMTWTGLRLTLIAAWAMTSFVFFLMFREGLSDVFIPAILFTLFVYLPVCTGKWMTEMPGFFFFFLSVYFYLRAVRRSDISEESGNAVDARFYAELTACGVALGLALFCKQFFLAAIPAMMGAYYWRTRRLFSSAIIGAPPLLTLVFFFLVWHGITSPYVRDVDPNHATIGVNWVRAWNAALYCGLYSIAGLPWGRRDIFNLKNWGIFFAVGAVMTLMFGGNIEETWALGPIQTAFRPFATRMPTLAQGASLWLASFGMALFCFFVLTLYRDWRGIQAGALDLFSLLFCALFIIENLAAGGTIPFYERYIYNLLFFIYFLLVRRVGTMDRRLVLAAAFIWLGLGQVILWTNPVPTYGPTCGLQWPLPPHFEDLPPH